MATPVVRFLPPPPRSYGDVLDSAKGWAASLRFSPSLLRQLNDFYRRPDTFSLGVCNGCQLMALLGWVSERHEAGGSWAIGLPIMGSTRA